MTAHSRSKATSRLCIEPGCTEQAGTPWTKLWCLKHDEERRDRITKSMEDILASMSGRGN